MQPSVPPASTASAWPFRICSAPSPIACDPVAQADTIAKFGPRIPSSIASCPLGESTSMFGMNIGETRSGPRSRRMSCCCINWLKPTDTGAEDDAGALRLVAVDPSVLHGFLGRREGEQDGAVEVPGALRRHRERRIEVLDLGGDLHREVLRVERPDEVDPAPALDEPLPGCLHVVSERRHGADTGYGHTSHPELDTGAAVLVAPITTKG